MELFKKEQHHLTDSVSPRQMEGKERAIRPFAKKVSAL
jgi:hypothetical protein